jgi:hypothetical protein
MRLNSQAASIRYVPRSARQGGSAEEPKKAPEYNLSEEHAGKAVQRFFAFTDRAVKKLSLFKT